jgi:penicillin-binding protein 1A
MASAYSAFANGGYKVTGHYISRITNNVGDIISEPEIPVACLACELDPNTISDLSNTERPATRIINTQTHFQAVGLMQGVTHFGTAAKAGRILKRADIAGKTGTTNDQKDAWFCGYMPKKVAIVWVGFDHLAPLGERETATGAALPVWIDFMKQRLANLEDLPWDVSERLIRVKLDAITGKVASSDSEEVVEEVIEKEYKSKTYEDSDSTGFEVFVDLPPETLLQDNQQQDINPYGDQGAANGGGRGNSAAPAPRAQPQAEKVEIPEQLF